MPFTTTRHDRRRHPVAVPRTNHYLLAIAALGLLVITAVSPGDPSSIRAARVTGAAGSTMPPVSPAGVATEGP